MRQAILAAVIVALLAAPAGAGDRAFHETLMSAATVASTSSVNSTVFDLRRLGTIEAVFFGCQGTGTADVKIEHSVSLDNVSFTDPDDYTDIVASTLLAFPNSPEGLNFSLLPVLPGRFVKFKVTGVASNPADTACTLAIAGRGVTQ